MVIDLSNLKSISLDNSTGHAVSQTGNRLGELATAIYNQGERALPHGTCPMVSGHVHMGSFDKSLKVAHSRLGLAGILPSADSGNGLCTRSVT